MSILGCPATNVLFADDTSFLISGKKLNEVIELLNVELKKICYWFRTNELSLHPGKTKFMIFTKNESNINFDELNIVLDNNNVNQNDENNIIKLSYVNSNSEIPAIKFLGVHIDPKLNFKHHINAIHSKVSRSLFAINSVKHFIDKRALKQCMQNNGKSIIFKFSNAFQIFVIFRIVSDSAVVSEKRLNDVRIKGRLKRFK